MDDIGKNGSSRITSSTLQCDDTDAVGQLIGQWSSKIPPFAEVSPSILAEYSLGFPASRFEQQNSQCNRYV